MAWSRRGMLLAGITATAALAGCRSGGLSASATPPPSTFEVTAVDARTVDR